MTSTEAFGDDVRRPAPSNVGGTRSHNGAADFGPGSSGCGRGSGDYRAGIGSSSSCSNCVSQRSEPWVSMHSTV